MTEPFSWNRISKSDPGPKFHVYLVPKASVRREADVKDAMYVDLGRLRAFKGSQRYPIPDGVDVKKYASVVIWCERFGVLITPADLNGTARNAEFHAERLVHPAPRHLGALPLAFLFGEAGDLIGQDVAVAWQFAAVDVARGIPKARPVERLRAMNECFLAPRSGCRFSARDFEPRTPPAMRHRRSRGRSR